MLFQDLYSYLQDCSNKVQKDMFFDCGELRSLDLSNFNTSSVTNMEKMFYGCDELNSLDLSHFNISSVTNMEKMFGNCWKLNCCLLAPI